MGQHKSNPTAIAAASGEIPPKEKDALSTYQKRQLMQRMIEELMIGDGLLTALKGEENIWPNK